MDKKLEKECRRVLKKLRTDKGVNPHYYRGARDMFKMIKSTPLTNTGYGRSYGYEKSYQKRRKIKEFNKHYQL